MFSRNGRRVVITGIGILGPTGIGLQAFWESIIAGRSGIGRITRFDPTSYPCQIAGEVSDKSYESLIEPRTLRTTALITQLAVAAAELALRDARVALPLMAPEEVGVSVGTAVGGWRDAEQQSGILLERGARRTNPFIINGAANHAAGIELATMVGAQGPQATFSVGCPAALQAIGHGAALVANGDLELCIAGGAETPITPLVFAALGRTMELSTRNDCPELACRPFDRDHCGMVLSEGSCFLVLETAERAAQRGVTPYAEVLSFASSCDARGLFAIDESGEVAGRTIYRALQRAGVDPSHIDYVCSHANSSQTFDRKETLVLKKAFGEWAPRLAISSIKGVLGHPFGAAGAFQAAAAVLAMQRETIPPTHNLVVPDPQCDLDYVPREPRSAPVRNALVTSYGYGGVNAYLILGKPPV